ncbi:acetyltransferase [Marispirochaeta aestuarii]|uniref:acetyltransferase n=1 Tax=Marispirochaeta aestuarii TaxID=1963862 RepID=UPI002ABDFC37|nr:acetyltransferase [Marispirochaeta aestuarii]
MVIIGSGGHARSVISMALNNHIAVEGIYDDSFNNIEFKQEILGIPLSGIISNAPLYIPSIVAIGDNKKREYVVNYYKLCLTSLVSKDSIVSHQEVVIGNGSCILPFAYIGPNTRIGLCCIINTGAVIEHDVRIGSYCHISIQSAIAGYVKIGNRCFIGAGATIIDKVEICDDVTIGAGAVVTKSIRKPGTYVGCPARCIE